MFPSKAFGKVEETDYSRNNTFGVMTREEGLRLTNELGRMTVPEERNIDYKEMIGMGTA